jgi:maleamate amidohydrolase
MTATDINLEANYAAGGFGQSLPWGVKPAVRVIDLCDAYLIEGSPLYAAAEPARASSARLVDAARSLSDPVIFTRVEFDPGGANGGLFFKRVGALRSFERGNPLAEFPDAPRPVEGEVVVTKQYASGFFRYVARLHHE